MRFRRLQYARFIAALLSALLLLSFATFALADDEPTGDATAPSIEAVEPMEEPTVEVAEEPTVEDTTPPAQAPVVEAAGPTRGEPGQATGLELSSNSIELGQSVTMTPLISGDASGFEFNYAWSWEGQWGDNWDSTVKRSGSRTSDASWEFTPHKPGTYSLWIDAVAPDGTTKQFDQSLQVNQEWQVESIQVGPTPGMVGTPVQVEVVFAAGSNTTNLSYNFVWRLEPGWSTWDSDIKSSGGPRNESSASLELPRAGSYDIWVDVIDANGVSTTFSSQSSYEVGLPYEVTGLELSASSIELGQSVIMTPQVSGDASAAEFNYVWSWEGQWGDNWDSTVKRTGATTGDASWEFTPSKPGAYRLWIDAQTADGGSKQYYRDLTVTQDWQVESISISPEPGALGTPVQVEVVFAPGSNTTNLSYNFVWRLEPGWSLWDSDKKDGGSPRSESTAALDLPKRGTYDIWVDVIDANGVSTTFSPSGSYTVGLPYQVTGLDLSSNTVAVGEPVTMSPHVTGDTTPLTINYAWSWEGQWGDDWDSTVKRTGSRTSELSWDFVPQKTGNYNLWIDAVSSDGEVQYFSASLTVTQGWDFDGIEILTPGPIERGNPVEFAAAFSGSRVSQLEVELAWQRVGDPDSHGSTSDGGCSFTGDDSAIFTPQWGGLYQLSAIVHDPVLGTTQTFDCDEPLKITRPWDFADPGLIVSKSSAKPGESIDLAIETTGDTTGLQYRFAYHLGSDGALTTIQDYSDSSSCTWTPDASGGYTVYGYVRDTYGEVDNERENIAVWDFTGIELEVIDGGVPGSLEKTVIIHPQLNCDNLEGFTFTYSWAQYSVSKGGIIAQDTNASSASWAPTEGYGTYTFIVDVTAPDGSTQQRSVSRWLQREDPYDGRFQYMTSSTSYLIIADSERCKVTIYRGSQYDWMPIRYWDCSPGAVGSPTPNGTYTVTGRGYSFSGSKGGTPYTCYYYTQFWGDYLFHTIEYYRGTWDVLDGRLGERISHGCVRLAPENAKWIYDNIPNGTKVYCFGSEWSPRG
ncbi:MAG: L,D-transpeptidase [Coriobacteriales bacterium]|nr:L,D-transpeptidase [Coriobacteriales bacterium]